MSQWVRLWDDMPTDPKWRVVSRRAGRPISEVLSVFVFMLTNAANASERNGTLANWDDEDVAAALDIDAAHVVAIREAMQGKTLDGDHLTGWERRQPKREDGAAERARLWREKKKQEEDEARELAEREAERNRTQPNAGERSEEKREDKKEANDLSIPHSAPPPAANGSISEKPKTIKLKDAFDQWYGEFPLKRERPAAQKSFERIVKGGKATFTDLMDGLAAYKRHNPPDRPWKYPATWLNKGCWLDQYDAPAGPGMVIGSAGPDWRVMLDLFCKGSPWSWANKSPPPGHPDCKIPAEIIAEFAGRLPPNPFAARAPEWTRPLPKCGKLSDAPSEFPPADERAA